MGSYDPGLWAEILPALCALCVAEPKVWLHAPVSQLCPSLTKHLPKNLFSPGPSSAGLAGLRTTGI